MACCVQNHEVNVKIGNYNNVNKNYKIPSRSRSGGIDCTTKVPKSLLFKKFDLLAVLNSEPTRSIQNGEQIGLNTGL